MNAWRHSALILLVASTSARSDTHEDEIKRSLEATACAGSTIGVKLEEEARIHSRRDLGWRFFPEGDATAAERAYRISKSMEVRYRWNVDHAGKVEAMTDQAKSLCQP